MTGTADPANPGGNPSAPWYGTPDPLLLGHMQNKGWDKLDAPAAALASAAAHREAQGFIGHPPELTLKLPKDAADEAGWKSVYQKLGAPADPKDYVFEGIDFGDAGVTTAFTDAIRAAAAARNVPKDMAADIAKAAFKFIEDRGKTDDTAASARLVADQKALDDAWGANKAANLLTAKQGASKIAEKIGADGVAKMTAAVDALDGQMGHTAVMEMFLAIGNAMGEGRFVSGDGQGGGGIASREQAFQQRFEKAGIDANGQASGKGDREWITRYRTGGAAELREMRAWNTLITGIVP